MEDTSLDEFLAETGEGEDDRPADAAGETTAEGEGADGAGGQPPGDGDSRDEIASTYAWDPEGGPCATCGDTATERWRDEAGLVCASCKEW